MKTRDGFVSNSSSSCFVCNTLKYRTKTIALDEVEEKAKIIFDFASKIGLLEPNVTYHDVFMEPRKATEDFIAELNADLDAGLTYNPDMIILQSAKDNSIPWSLFELIEDIFHATRIHMG